MKNRTYLFFLIFIVTLLFVFKDKKSKQIVNEQITKETRSSQIYPDEYEINNFRVIVKDVTEESVEIIPNFNENKTSQFIIDTLKCDTLINGGLYEKNGNPLGLFYLNGKYYSDIKSSDLYDGILILNKNNKWEISDIDLLEINEENRLYMQTGPILKLDGIFRKMSVSDAKARRIIFAQDENKYLIIALTDPDNYNSGPQLSEIEDVLKNLKVNYGINVINAINLDGGNSSLYIDSRYFLKESVFSGSFICFREK